MVTMDQLLVDLGDVPADADDEVVLIGRQGDDEITATEWAERLGTISYEVVTGIGARVPAHLRRRATLAMAQKALKRTGLVAGATAGAIGLAYATERALVARLRHRDDPDAGDDTRSPSSTRPRIIDSHDGGTLYTISRGTGPVVVFCHGVTLSSRVWAKQFASFPAAGFRAVAFDSRGHGESLAGDTGHSLDNLADDLRTVLETLDLRDVILVGHSMGGMAVQAFAIRHPDVVDERVRGLVLLSTSSHNLVSDAKRVRGTIERVVNVGPDVGTFMRQRNLGLLLARIGFGDDPHPSAVEATREMLAACDKATTREAVVRAAAPRPHRGAAEAADPALVVVGTADALTPPARRPPHRRAAARCPPRGVPGRRAHAHVRAHRRARRADHGLRSRPAGGRRPDRHPPRTRADVITDVPGVLAGHWTGAATGVTVVVFPPETVGSVEIRGGAPATRETAVLDPFATVEHVDAIVLTGGSAFGLASADGVVRALAEQGRGFPTRGGPVPIVPAAAIFDLVVAGDERPGADEGRAALAAALDPAAPRSRPGRVGAGRGASVAKWRGGEHGTTGGVGQRRRRATASSSSPRSWW